MPDHIEKIKKSKSSYLGPRYDSLNAVLFFNQNMKLLIHEYLTVSGFEADDMPLIHYLTDRLESQKFVIWNRNITAQIVANYDDALAKDSYL